MNKVLMAAFAAALISPSTGLAKEGCVHYVYTPGELVTSKDWKMNKTEFCQNTAILTKDGWVLTDLDSNYKILKVSIND